MSENKKKTITEEEKRILIEDEARQKEIAEIFAWFNKNRVRVDLSQHLIKINFDLILELLEIAGITNRISFMVEQRKRYLEVLKAVKNPKVEA